MQPAVGREGKNEEMVFFCVLYNTRTLSCLCGDRRETLSWTCVAASHTQALNSFKRLCAVDAQMHYSSLKPAGDFGSVLCGSLEQRGEASGEHNASHILCESPESAGAPSHRTRNDSKCKQLSGHEALIRRWQSIKLIPVPVPCQYTGGSSANKNYITGQCSSVVLQ